MFAEVGRAIWTMFRVVTFRASREELQSLNRVHLLVGLLSTWLVGIGRWWEDSRASLFQHTGIGSVIYVFVLALFLWILLWPMGLKHMSYFNVVTFVSFTSPPALLYAIPIRHGLELETAQAIRMGLLAVVAGWRVALLVFFLVRGAQYSAVKAAIGTPFPLTIIVFSLTILNLEKVVFDFMGFGETTVNDSAYFVMVLLSFLSMIGFVPLLICYVVVCVQARSKEPLGPRAESPKE